MPCPPVPPVTHSLGPQTWASTKHTPVRNRPDDIGTVRGVADMRPADCRRPPPVASQTAPNASPVPGAVVRSPVWLNEKNSLSLREPMLREDRAGDIRLDCEDDVDCALQSDSSVFVQMFNGKLPPWPPTGTSSAAPPAPRTGPGHSRRTTAPSSAPRTPQVTLRCSPSRSNRRPCEKPPSCR